MVRRRKEEGGELAGGLTAAPPPFPIQPHLPADKAQVAPGSEQQHLLTTAPSSSSSSLESEASASHRGTPTRNQPQAPGRDQPRGSGEAQAGSGNSGKWRGPTWLHPPLCDSSWFLPEPLPPGPQLPAGPEKPCTMAMACPPVQHGATRLFGSSEPPSSLPALPMWVLSPGTLFLLDSPSLSLESNIQAGYSIAYIIKA